MMEVRIVDTYVNEPIPDATFASVKQAERW